MKYKSFTLIELLIVFAIISILAASTLPSFYKFSETKGVDRQIAYIISDIGIARNKALSNAFDDNGTTATATDDSNFWAVRFVCAGSNNTYQLGYFDNAATPVWRSKQTKTFPDDFSFTCTTHIDLKFTRGTGVLYNPIDSSNGYSNIVINYKTTSKTLRVYINGKIEIL